MGLVIEVKGIAIYKTKRQVCPMDSLYINCYFRIMPFVH